MNKEEIEKIYKFNEYVLGYDKGLNDRSCLTISKIQSGNMYVMATLYDGSADVISLMLDSLQQQNKEIQKRIDKAIKYITIYRSYANINGRDYLKGRDEIGSLELSQVDDLLEILEGGEKDK